MMEEPIAVEELEPVTSQESGPSPVDEPSPRPPAVSTEQLGRWIAGLVAARRFQEPDHRERFVAAYMTTVVAPVESLLGLSEVLGDYADLRSLPPIVRFVMGVGALVVGALVVQPDGSIRLPRRQEAATS